MASDPNYTPGAALSVLAAFAAAADADRVGPLSLVDEFDRPLTDHLGVPDPIELLTRLESAGLVTAESADSWRWQAEIRAAAQADFVSRAPATGRALEARLATWFTEHNQPKAALAHALASGDPTITVDVIEAFWRVLTIENPYDLAQALAVTPLAAIQDRPMAYAVRHMWPVPPLDPATLPAPPLLTTAARAAVGAGDEVRRAIDTDLALALVYRIRGRYRGASSYADEMIELTHLAQAAGTPGIDPLVAGGLIQVAMIHLLRGEYEVAIGLLLEGEAFVSVSDRASAGRDIANRLNLAYAMRGELAVARGWATKAEARANPAELLTAQVIDSAGTIGQALQSISVLDSAAAAAALAKLTPGPLKEELWAPELYARSCFALGWGDRLGVLYEINQTRGGRADFAESQRNDGAAGPLLAATEGNLLMSLGRGSQAWATLNYGTTPPLLLAPARARLALLTGEPATVLTIADGVTAADPGLTIELTLLRAAALLRLGRADEATAALTEAGALAGGELFVFAQIPRTDLRGLLALRPVLSDEQFARLPDIFPESIALIILTPQEQLALDELSTDKTLGELAAELHVSEGTIKTHRQHLYRKLGVNSREEALATASELGLFSSTN